MNREVCDIVNSIRNKPKLIARGYLLTNEKSQNDRYYWCCEFKEAFNCKERAITSLENGEHVLVKFNNHSHAPEASHVDVSYTLNIMKETAVRTQDQPIQIIQNAIVNMPQDSFYYMPNKKHYVNKLIALEMKIMQFYNHNLYMILTFLLICVQL